MMRVFRGFESLGQPFENAVVAVGSFDGVHRGHRMLFAKMREKAREIGGQMVVVTFDPHPRQVLRGDNRLISTLDEKLLLMEHAGVENVVVIHFTNQFSSIDGSSFLRDYLVGKLGMRVVFASEGHHYGHDRVRGVDLYERHGVEWVVLERLENISSTMIRELLLGGQIERAQELLGEPYLTLEPVVDPTKIIVPVAKRELVNQ